MNVVRSPSLPMFHLSIRTPSSRGIDCMLRGGVSGRGCPTPALLFEWRSEDPKNKYRGGYMSA
jgi:hypothetical protein